MSSGNGSPVALLPQATAYVNGTNAKYSTLLRPDIKTQPMLYFGDLTVAEYATFGVNPSATEFTSSRWPNPNLTVQQVHVRSVDYFHNPAVPAHPWFDGYENSLTILGHSYRTDSVHLDLSPRATKAMRSTDRHLFCQMIAADMQWFLSALAHCGNLKAAIMSGSVTGKYYFDEFLKAHLPTAYSLTLRTRLGNGRRGATALYDLIGPGLTIPVFFCGTSPSGDRGVRLASEVGRNLPVLKAAGF